MSVPVSRRWRVRSVTLRNGEFPALTQWEETTQSGLSPVQTTRAAMRQASSLVPFRSLAAGKAGRRRKGRQCGAVARRIM